MRMLRHERELGAVEKERQECEALKKQLSELAARVEALEIRAPAHGTILTPNVDSLVGTYVQQGDAILMVGE